MSRWLDTLEDVLACTSPDAQRDPAQLAARASTAAAGGGSTFLPHPRRHRRLADARRRRHAPGVEGTLKEREIWQIVDYVMSLPYEPASGPDQDRR